MEGRRRAARYFGDARGQSVIEIALLMPFLAITLIGALDITRAFSARLAVQNGARAGAEESVLDVTPTVAEAVSAVQGEISRTPGLDPTQAIVSVAYTLADGTSPCTGAPDTRHAGTSSQALPCYVTVEVRYTWSTLVAWPGLPTQFIFDRTTRMRRYQ